MYDSNFSTNHDRKRKIVIIKHIEHRTSQGNLISLSKNKTVLFGRSNETYADNDLLLCGQLNTGLDFRENSFPKSIHKQSSRTEPTIYNYKWEPKRIPTSDRFLDEQSIGEESATAGSTDTCVKQAILINQSCCFDDQVNKVQDLRGIIDRINHYRRIYNVPILHRDDALTQRAKAYASQMIFDKKIWITDDPMNIWTGKRITDRIAEEWNHEMSTYWNRNNFRRSDLTKIGIANARCEHLKLEIVVAMYM